ncbi:SDR family NAD(P)-dependent oxidoreductase [Sphingobium tyrosinilyticum]|uniref:SDR family NAD(P)-dependent oxidoreductase n=1 Tax=Sphingobium tyrosinilyticum TaxID=2715436 RepID=A0ABV9F1H4_9SPHN
MKQNFEGRSILVTGGASGIGRSVALLCGEAGAAVTVTDVNSEQGTQVAEEIVQKGGQAQFVQLDVADEAQHHAAVAAAVKAFGKLDGSCNAAGKPFQGRLMHEIDPDFWERVYALNLRSVFFSIRAQVPAMLQGGGGSIVNVASTAGVAAFPAGADYCAAKGGVLSATRAAALDYAKLGIRVNSVLPGATRTAMMQGQFDAFEGLEEMVMAGSPMGRLAEPNEIAYAIRWLLSDEASFVTGSMMVVDGGLTAA